MKLGTDKTARNRIMATTMSIYVRLKPLRRAKPLERRVDSLPILPYDTAGDDLHNVPKGTFTSDTNGRQPRSYMEIHLLVILVRQSVYGS